MNKNTKFRKLENDNMSKRIVKNIKWNLRFTGTFRHDEQEGIDYVDNKTVKTVGENEPTGMVKELIESIKQKYGKTQRYQVKHGSAVHLASLFIGKLEYNLIKKINKNMVQYLVKIETKPNKKFYVHALLSHHALTIQDKGLYEKMWHEITGGFAEIKEFENENINYFLEHIDELDLHIIE